MIRKFATKNKGFVGPAIAACLFLIVAASDFQRQRRVLNDMDNVASTMIRGAAGAPPTTVGGDTLTMNYVVAKVASESYGAWQTYGTAITAAGEDWLSPANLSSSAGRASAERISQDLRRASGEFDGAIKAAIEHGAERLRTLGRVRPEYAAASQGYARGVGSSLQMLDRFIRIEHQFLDAVDELLAVVIDAQPTLSRDGSTLLFAHDQHVDQYNRWLSEVERLAAEEADALAALRTNNAAIILRSDSLRSMIRQ